jgi:hypothetical protein
MRSWRRPAASESRAVSTMVAIYGQDFRRVTLVEHGNEINGVAWGVTQATPSLLTSPPFCIWYWQMLLTPSMCTVANVVFAIAGHAGAGSTWLASPSGRPLLYQTPRGTAGGPSADG